MLINNWYVAAESADIEQGKPHFVQMLGCDFVLWRKVDGEVVCLSNVCCHRGASLAHGKVIDDCVQCPFHGWRFDETGKCVAIPSMGPDFNIPERARIDRYPVVEKYDWVWVFLGDLPEEKRPPVPDFLPEFSDTENWRTTRLTYEADVNWTKAEENNIDTAHLSFVHSAFGSRQDPRATIVPIQRMPFGAKVARERTAPKSSQKSGKLGELLKEERSKTRVSLEFSLLGLAHRIHPEFRPGVSQITLGTSVPIDPYRTRFFGLQTRNYAIEPEGDEERIKGRLQARDEDLAVSTRIRPRVGPTNVKDEVLVKADQMEVLFRQCIARLERKGWMIDWDKMQAEMDTRVFVIPSPERRKNPEGWAHEPVPTTRPRVDDEEWLIHTAEEQEKAA